MLGPNDAWVRAVLNGSTPEEAAKYYVANTKLGNPDYRKALIGSGAKEIFASTDPMIVMARRIAGIQDSIRLWYEKNITGILASAEEAIGKCRFAVYGKALPPDATFTLRLSYGQVKG